MSIEKSMNSSADIRSFLLDQMKRVAAGEQDTGTAKAVSNYAQQIYNTINLEVKMATLKQKNGGKSLALEAVQFSGK